MACFEASSRQDSQRKDKCHVHDPASVTLLEILAVASTSFNARTHRCVSVSDAACQARSSFRLACAVQPQPSAPPPRGPSADSRHRPGLSLSLILSTLARSSLMSPRPSVNIRIKGVTAGIFRVGHLCFHSVSCARCEDVFFFPSPQFVLPIFKKPLQEYWFDLEASSSRNRK